jgi:DNA segregation ATPase FtsK/SpoIIIE, S-DNA-T family
VIAEVGHWIVTGGWAIAVLIAARLAFGLVRFARLPRAAKRNYPAALWARFRWRWLARNLQLAYLDQHRRASRRPSVPFGTSVKVKAPTPGAPMRLRFPRARFSADEFGIIARVKTVPGVGRAEFDRNAPHIADAWRCVRVQVSQPKPGRVVVRGLRSDPLLVPYSAANLMPGASGSEFIPHGETIRRLYIGRDEWGADRYLPLRGVTGITVGGLPGYGKTTLVNSWLCQLAGSAAVQFVIIDGKGAAEYDDWRDRAWIYTGDELPAASAALEDCHSLMRARFAQRGRDASGPTSEFPMVVTVIDEAHTFMDLEAVKGDRQAEAHVRACRALTAQLVKKGRVALMLTIVMTQKQTGDAVPTTIRDNCPLSLSFAVRTKEAAVASLGDHIREYPGHCPTGLQDPAYVGVATASLRTNMDPFVRVRVPEISDQAARQRAAQTASLRRDPTRPLVQLVKQSALTLT